MTGRALLLALALTLAACQHGDPGITLADLPEGDAERGAVIFRAGAHGTIACSTCHRTDHVDQAGPGLEGIGERAARRVPGLSAREYLLTSIVRPARYLVTGFSNLMPGDYGSKLSRQELADLIAYLMTL